MLLIQHALLPPVLLADADQWYQHYYNATMSVQAFTKTSLLQRHPANNRTQLIGTPCQPVLSTHTQAHVSPVLYT